MTVQIDELWDRARTEGLPPALRDKALQLDNSRFQNLVELVEDLAAKVPDRKAAKGQPELLAPAAHWLLRIELCVHMQVLLTMLGRLLSARMHLVCTPASLPGHVACTHTAGAGGDCLAPAC